MRQDLLTIGQASDILGVSIQTLRRWDKNGQLRATRGNNTSYRYYPKDILDRYIKNSLKNMFKFAKNWVSNESGLEPPSDFYCQNSFIFQARLSRLENELGKIKGLENIFPLISASTGEIGNNSFDHNLGNWQDIPGIFFYYNLKKGEIILADRGQGILATLKKVKPDLNDHQDALKVAFTEIISGRAPEARGQRIKICKKCYLRQ